MSADEQYFYINNVFNNLEQFFIYMKLKHIQCFKQLNIPVTVEQFAMLNAIYANENVSQSDLSKLTKKDRSNATRIITTLETEGYVERLIGVKDKRLAKKVCLTSVGKKKCGRM